ncbi:STAS domain-containing protein [Streptomyces pseudogriseolus]|uniref:Anti-sigma factor antagonist n=1 Tax=Streptomyces sp. R17 TaxID=3238626 RepID=A0AB39NXF0_9ACTN|nr:MULTISPECIES: STAS domain-containing protein [unclassified Streptomyces]MCI4146389.1 STAS domain-containing protein [Streptomyces sp. MMS20-AI2-20]GGQ06202.1 anti-sigma factor antagonist [Streptomyces gancidicus]
MKPLTIVSSRTPAGPLLEVAGDLDHSNAQQLRRAAAGAVLSAGLLLVVDLGELGFCDSSGITALIAVRNHVVAAGAGLVLVAVPETLRRLLSLTGLDQVFDLRDSHRLQAY